MSNYLLVFLAGGLTTLSPCVLPALPLVVGGAVQEHRYGPLAIAAGLAFGFASIGVFMISVGLNLGIDDTWIRQGAAILLLICGVIFSSSRAKAVFLSLSSPIANRAQELMSRRLPSGLLGQFFVGLLLGAIWTPCSGPTLGVAIGLAAQEGGVWPAIVQMSLFGFGAVIPLLLISTGARKFFLSRREKLGLWASKGQFLLGVGLILVAGLILTGLDGPLEALILGALPDWWVELSTSI